MTTEGLKRLHAAIEDEKLQNPTCIASYLELTNRMTIYALGDGPAPSVVEFLTWRNHTAQDLQRRGLPCRLRERDDTLLK